MDSIQPDLVQAQSEDSPLNKILKILLTLLIIVFVGLGGFLLFQLNNNKQPPSATTLTPQKIPTVSVKKDQVIISPTVKQEDPANIDVGSVEEDIKNIGADVQNLQ